MACCLDGSDASRAALAEARRLRAIGSGRLSLVHVIASPSALVSVAAQLGGGTMNDPELEREAARMWFEEEAAEAPEAEAVLLEGEPASTACDWARETGCDLMVAASHSGLIERALVGSFAGYLAYHAPCAVLLVRPEPGMGG